MRNFYRTQKSIDTVSHDIPLGKLNHYGITGIPNDWLRSYLSDRTQLVSINRFNSDYNTAKYGFSSRLLTCVKFY